MPSSLSRTCQAIKLDHPGHRCGLPATWALKNPHAEDYFTFCPACKDIHKALLPGANDEPYYTIAHLLTQGHTLEPVAPADPHSALRTPHSPLRVMLDVETLGTRPGCAIRAIGACTFGNGKIGREFYVRIDLDSCVRAGLHLDPDTILWWMRQPDDARAEFCNGNCVALQDALTQFNDWMFAIAGRKSFKGEIWGNGADFDPPILAEAYFTLDRIALPWPDRSARCYRTMKNQRPDIPFVPPALRHHALHDARAQALHLLQIEDALRGSELILQS